MPKPNLEENTDSAESPTVLARKIRAGDPSAEVRLIQRLSPGLRVLLRRLTREPSLADDIHQETFAVVLPKLRNGELREPDAVAAFTRSTARNLLIAHQRKEVRFEQMDPVSETSDHRPWRIDSRPAAPQLQEVLAREEASAVRTVLSSMKHQRDRSVLLRYYLTEASKQEICRDLEIEPRLFNRVLYRARQRMLQLWVRHENQSSDEKKR